MAVSIALPSDFQQSIVRAIDYPENLPPRSTSTYRSTLKSYRERLDEAEPDLCLLPGEDDIDNDFEVSFRDLNTATGKDVDKRNTHSPEDATKWLGIEISPDPLSPGQKIVRTTKKDPSSRFVYIYAENSRDQLKITRDTLVQILAYHQVMPVYLDFMLVFGAQSEPRDLRFSGFREQNFMRASARGPALPELGRSGQHFQICYNLKGVSFKKRDDGNIKLNEWSIRQAAFYHQFDVKFGTSLWIVTKGRQDIQQRYKELTGPDGRAEDKSFGSVEECFRSSLAVHLMYCHWSTEDWRWYIRWLENVIDMESSMAVYGPRGPGYAHRQYKPFHIQDMQYWQDKTNEAVMVLESNIEVIGALQRFYANLRESDGFPDALKSGCKDDIATFTAHLNEITNDFAMQASRAKLLANIINDRKELVLQHLQGQAADRTERLNRNLEREAIVMRIITIVTLLYLPATFVSTFFSTDVIKYQNQGESDSRSRSGTFSSIALTRWLQVTLPLTALTLFGAWSTYKFAESARLRSDTTFTEIVPTVDNGEKKPYTLSIFNRHRPRHSSRTPGRSWNIPAAFRWKRLPLLPLHRPLKATS
ncbi:hypothetical protein B0J11DRAFT_578738 [Dendryphion nanum]|uniref:CorA-like transporter domain-containing protein n=1 Tax=Dendryphion nanum TaxID=256645 RepID=A0A9P9E224_9PLEO|nr:hypothetical protein B0J11DRAFT_578738 [Dendryphion nanum]